MECQNVIAGSVKQCRGNLDTLKFLWEINEQLLKVQASKIKSSFQNLGTEKKFKYM